jgi:hypothetical protein
MPQLRHAYGADLAAALAAQPQTWLVLRTVEPDPARWLESALGNAEVDELQESYSIGGRARGAASESVSVQQRRVQRPIALASEIASLPDHEGFLRLPGGKDVYRVVSTTKNRTPIAAPFVPRSHTIQVPATPATEPRPSGARSLELTGSRDRGD